VAAALDELGASIYGGGSKGGASLARAIKVVRIALATPTTAPAAEAAVNAGEHGWVCWNDGPCGWFWFPTRAECEHELSDDIRPATALEKALLNRRGNRLVPEDNPAAAARSAAEEMRERCVRAIGKWHLDRDPNPSAMTEGLARELMQWHNEEGRIVQECQHIIRAIPLPGEEA
jgi:hypothetical protein